MIFQLVKISKLGLFKKWKYKLGQRATFIKDVPKALLLGHP